MVWSQCFTKVQLSLAVQCRACAGPIHCGVHFCHPNVPPTHEDAVQIRYPLVQTAVLDHMIRGPGMPLVSVYSTRHSFHQERVSSKGLLRSSKSEQCACLQGACQGWRVLVGDLCAAALPAALPAGSTV